MKFWHKISLYAGSGILMGVGFLLPILWIVGLLGMALFLWIIAKEEAGQIWGSYLAWFIKFLFVLGFYWTIYPIHWLPFDFGGKELILVILYWLTVSAFVGTGGLVFGIFYKISRGAINSTRWLAYLVLPVLWVLAEIAGSFLLSVFTYGPGALLNAYFNLGYSGLLLGEHPLFLYLAQYGGVYLLSFIAAGLALWFSRRQLKFKKPKWLIISVAVVILLLGTVGANVKLPVDYSRTTEVAVIGVHFPVEELFNREALPDIHRKQEVAFTTAINTGADYIVLPEDARFFGQEDDARAGKNYFNFKYSSSTAVIVDSSRTIYGGQSVLQGFLFDAETNEHSFIHKKYLVPQGEFVPYFYEHLFNLLGFGFLIDELKSTLSYTIGPNTSQADLPEHYPGVLFCFESSSGLGVRTLIEERPSLPFVAHPVSHTWFNSPESLWTQIETSLKVQAVWNDVAIVSANRHGPSQMFLPNGEVEELEVIESQEHWEVGVFTVPLR